MNGIVQKWFHYINNGRKGKNQMFVGLMCDRLCVRLV